MIMVCKTLGLTVAQRMMAYKKTIGHHLNANKMKDKHIMTSGSVFIGKKHGSVLPNVTDTRTSLCSDICRNKYDLHYLIEKFAVREKKISKMIIHTNQLLRSCLQTHWLTDFMISAWLYYTQKSVALHR